MEIVNKKFTVSTETSTLFPFYFDLYGIRIGPIDIKSLAARLYIDLNHATVNASNCIYVSCVVWANRNVTIDAIKLQLKLV